jgi:hypothetical protein
MLSGYKRAQMLPKCSAARLVNTAQCDINTNGITTTREAHKPTFEYSGVRRALVSGFEVQGRCGDAEEPTEAPRCPTDSISLKTQHN